MIQDGSQHAKEFLLTVLGNNLEGPSSYLEKFLHIQNLAGSKCDVEQTIKKLRFFAYELENYVTSHPTLTHKLDILREYFFNVKGFTPIPSHQVTQCQDIFIDQVLAKRKGHPLTLCLLFQTLANWIGIDLTYVALGRSVRLKYVEGGNSHFLDLSKSANPMDKSETLELFNKHNGTSCDLIPEDLEPLSIHNLLSAFLYRFERVCLLHDNQKDLLVIYNMLLEINPSSLDALAKRASLKFNLGMYRDSQLDIKRYAYFCEKSELPSDLKKIEESLSVLN